MDVRVLAESATKAKFLSLLSAMEVINGRGIKSETGSATECWFRISQVRSVPSSQPTRKEFEESDAIQCG